MKYGEIGDECWTQDCYEKSTHLLTMRVRTEGYQYEVTYPYCLRDAMYFAGWLPYCYPGKQELVSIMPPSSEMFGR
jgi:hypothetical protein